MNQSKSLSEKEDNRQITDESFDIDLLNDLNYNQAQPNTDNFNHDIELSDDLGGIKKDINDINPVNINHKNLASDDTHVNLESIKNNTNSSSNSLGSAINLENEIHFKKSPNFNSDDNIDTEIDMTDIHVSDIKATSNNAVTDDLIDNVHTPTEKPNLSDGASSVAATKQTVSDEITSDERIKHASSNTSTNEVSSQNHIKQQANKKLNDVKHISLIKGRCTNLPNECSNSQSGELQNMADSNSRCKECNSLLYKQTERQSKTYSRSIKYILLAILSIIAIALAIWLLSFLNTENTTSNDENKTIPSDGMASDVIASDVIASENTSSLQKNTTDESTDLGSVSIENKLNIQTSDTIGASLMPKIINTYNTLQGNEIIENKSSSSNTTLVYQLPSKEQYTVNLNSKDSVIDIDALINNKTDLVISPNKLSQEMVKSASLEERAVGVDGITVIVHHSNPINSLTKDQLRELFTGKYLNWKEIGGVDQKINLYIRDEDSSTRRTFESLILNKIPMSNAKVFDNTKLLSDAVNNDPGGIGYTEIPHVNNATLLAIAHKADTQAYKPTLFSIADQSYPLTRHLYMYLPTNPTEEASNLADFITSEEGQQVVQESGFSLIGPQVYSTDFEQSDTQNNIKNTIDEGTEIKNTEVESTEVESTKAESAEAEIADVKSTKTSNLTMVDPNDSKVLNISKDYKTLSANAKQVDVSIRFNNNNSELNRQAKKDLAQLGSLMADFHNQGETKQLVLMGFADNHGDACLNDNLSIDRAMFVAKELKRKYGIKAAIANGMGANAPVADNMTVTGRQQNRRVEVWLADAPNLDNIPTKQHIMCQ